MNSSWSELTEVEKNEIKKKVINKEESLQKLDNQFWQALKNFELQKADKCAKIYLFIKQL